MSSPNPRYQGKPLLRLLECYVLWAIGELSPESDANLRKMLPHLQATFKTTGTWQEVVAASVELPPDLPERIRELWVKNTEIARRMQTTLTPQAFAEMFVDQNLVG